MLKVVVYPDDRLREKSKEVTNFKDKKKIVDEIALYCKNGDAYAMAASQFGIMERFVVVSTNEEVKKDEDKEKINVTVYFNPKIVEVKGKQNYFEGCVSVDGIVGRVSRPYYIKLEYQDIEGHKQIKEISGFEAIILCHEIDHLDGILYTDKCKFLKKANNKNERLEIRKKYPLKVISKDGKFSEDKVNKRYRTIIYN